MKHFPLSVKLKPESQIKYTGAFVQNCFQLSCIYHFQSSLKDPCNRVWEEGEYDSSEFTGQAGRVGKGRSILCKRESSRAPLQIFLATESGGLSNLQTDICKQYINFIDSLTNLR